MPTAHLWWAKRAHRGEFKAHPHPRRCSEGMILSGADEGENSLKVATLLGEDGSVPPGSRVRCALRHARAPVLGKVR
jgi:hypothetical protein